MPEAEPGKPDLAATPRRALEITLQIGIVLLVGMPAIAILQPFLPRLPVSAVLAGALLLPGIWFWRGAANMEGHVRAVSEDIADVLAKQSGPRNTGGDAQALRRIREGVPGLGNIVSLRLGLGNHCVGKTLAEMHVGSLTGAAILVILRDDGEALIPTGKDILRVGDLLALAGPPEAVEAARRILLSGPVNAR
jgi:CPA2 family monovalent cation:H+ antiporter-2